MIPVRLAACVRLGGVGGCFLALLQKVCIFSGDSFGIFFGIVAAELGSSLCLMQTLDASIIVPTVTSGLAPSSNNQYLPNVTLARFLTFREAFLRNTRILAPLVHAQLLLSIAFLSPLACAVLHCRQDKNLTSTSQRRYTCISGVSCKANVEAGQAHERYTV